MPPHLPRNSIAAPSPNIPPLRFGIFELEPQTGELRKSGRKTRLRPQAARALAVLAAHAGELVTREQFKEEIWGQDTFVDFEHGLNLCIREIRAALDDDAEMPRYIETLPRRGYRFIAPIEQPEQSLPPAFSPTPAGPPTLPDEAPGKKPRVFAAALVALALLGLVALAWRLSVRPATVRTGSATITSLAVLPLENLSHDPDQEYFADGMTVELITDLAKIHSLRVISRNSVIAYKGKHLPVPQIGRELNVDAVIEGTVMRSGNRVRITAQLIEAQHDQHLWAEAYEGDVGDVLILQDQVAQAIAAAIKGKVAPEEKVQLSGARVVNPQAHEAYLRGIYELHGMAVKPTPELKEEAVGNAAKYFEQAIQLDPNDARAYAALADTYSSMITIHKAPLDVMPKAKAAAVRAVEIDDSLAEAHASLAYMALTYDWDWRRAEREFQRALELNPSLPQAHLGYGKYLFFIPHRTEEAIREWRRAYALDPLLPSATGDLAWFLFLARRYNESIEEARRMPDRNYHTLALDFAELGRVEEAVAAADRSLTTTQNPIIRSQATAAYAIAGRKDKARAMLDSVINFGRLRYLCGFNVGSLFAVLGDKEQAYKWLEKAYRDRSD